MLDQVPGFAVAQAADDLAYKTVTLPPLRAEAGSYFTAYDEGSNAFLVCARDASLPGPDGEPLLRVVYVLDAGGFDELHTAADYEAALRASFPAPLTSEHYAAVAEQLVDARLCRGSLNTRVSQLHGQGCILIGDAAHSMWPTLGQGINAALEDTAVLGRLQTCQGCGVDALPQLFHEARHADAMAAVVLTERAYGGKHAVSRAAIVQSMLRMSLHRLLPGLMRAPALHLMNETVAGYAAILGLAEEEERVLNTAALGVGVGAAAAVAFAAALLATTARAVAASIGVGVLLAGAGM